MNSEELEQSLKAEFETYLNGVLAKMRGDVDEFQAKIESEFEKHRSQIGNEFRSLSDRFESVPEFDGGFTETVVEHLRLARDEGAKITANAFAEAEKLEQVSAPSLDLSEIKDAINDISSNDTQATILKSLISHAATYTPRGAFFIVKNEHFVGWKLFGDETDDADTAVRDIRFPVSEDSILGAATRSLGLVEGSFGSHEADSDFLEPLGFGRPDRMYAIPLIARGRGVAVLYCDYGHEGVSVNTDALEMLVKVAGITVELHAVAKAVHAESYQEAADHAESGHETVDHAPVSEPEVSTGYADQAAETPVQSYDETPRQFESSFETLRPVVETPPFEPSYPFAETLPEATGVEVVDEPDVIPAAPETAAVSEFQPPVYQFDEPAQDVVPENEVYGKAFDEPEAAAPDGYGELGNIPVQGSEPEVSRFDAEPATVPVSYEFETVTAFDEKVSEPEQIETAAVETLEDERPAYTFDSGDLAEPVAAAQNEVEEPQEVVVTGTEIVFDSPVEEVTDHTEEDSTSYSPVYEAEPAEISETIEPAPFAETPKFEPSPFDRPVSESGVSEPEVAGVATNFVTGTEPMRTKPVTRLSDRNVDLPIEVPENERRLHNDARRFARLLVSEIKLYNEKKVQEGRESNDLYERLREAIDRSREMYDKRVQPPVAETFDYFHYELVNSLAEGEETRLGHSYKGAAV